MSRSALKIAAVSFVALLAACSDTPQGPSQADIDKQIDDRFNALPQAPKAASIQAFTVSAASIKVGESATLSWAVSDAVAVSVKDGDGRAIAGVDPTALTGTATVTPDHDTTYVLQAQGEGGNDFALVRVVVAQKPIVFEPAPLLFAGVPLEINAGEAAYLVWNSPENVLITDDANTELSATTKVGSLAVKPLKNTTYTAKTNTSPAQTATVAVKVNPVIGVFTSDKTGAVSGEGVKLRWITAGAESVVLSERSRGTLYTAASATDRNDHVFEDAVPANLPNGTVLVYTLTVKNPNMVKTADVSVAITTDPKINLFSGPGAITKGSAAKATLSWTTTGGTALEIYSGPTGTTPTRLEYRAPTTAIASGSVGLPQPAADTDYQLVLTGDLGAQVSRSVTVKVVGPPAITSFTSNPATKVTNAGDKATLTFAATNASSAYIAVVGGGAVYSTDTSASGDTAEVFPVQPATYKLVVKNAAGDKAEKTLSLGVDNPANVTVSPSPSMPGEQVTVTWDLTSTTATGIVPASFTGFTKVSGRYEELASSPGAKVLTTPTLDDSYARLDFPDDFAFPYYGVLYQSATVSTNGWLSFTTQTSSTSSNPSSMPSTTTPNNVIALLWDDLKLDATEGRILYEVRGSGASRRLIIEYYKNRRYGQTSTEVTAEFVLYANGGVELHYGTVVDNASTAFNATIGLENVDGTEGVLVGTTLPASGEGYVFDRGAAGPLTGTITVKPTESFTGVLLTTFPTSSGGTVDVPVLVPVKVLASNSVAVSEVLYKPVAGTAGSLGQWFELVNNTGSSLKVDELTVTTAGNSTPMPLGTGTFAPGQVIVVGQSKDTTLNGGVTVNFELATMVLSQTADTIKVFLRGATTELAKLSYDDATVPATAGTSVLFMDPTAPGAYKMAGGVVGRCLATTPIGTTGTTASPGTATEKCGLFTASSNAAAYSDISASGTLLFSADGGSSPGTTNTRLRRKLVFPTGFTFPFDGQTQSQAFVSGCGYLTFDPTATETDNDPNCNNPSTFPTTVSSSDVKGVLAVYWEYLYYLSTSTTGPRPKTYTKLVGDTTAGTAALVIQWTNNAEYDGSSTAPTDANFQVVLFQNGDIEYRYGDLNPGTASTQAYMEGTAMSVGVVKLDGTAGHVYSHNQQRLKANTGIHWTKL